MIFSIGVALLYATSALAAAIISRQSSSKPSCSFIVHSRFTNATDFIAPYSSLGYLYPKYSYPPGYSATLNTDKSVAIVGYLSDVYNVSNSTLSFNSGEGSYMGFVLSQLSLKFTAGGYADIFAGQMGTKGMFIDKKGRLGWESDGGPVEFYGMLYQCCVGHRCLQCCSLWIWEIVRGTLLTFVSYHRLSKSCARMGPSYRAWIQVEEPNYSWQLLFCRFDSGIYIKTRWPLNEAWLTGWVGLDGYGLDLVRLRSRIICGSRAVRSFSASAVLSCLKLYFIIITLFECLLSLQALDIVLNRQIWCYYYHFLTSFCSYFISLYSYS